MQEGARRSRSVGTEFIWGIMEDILELDIQRAAYNIYTLKIRFLINTD